VAFLQTTQDIIGGDYFDAWGINRNAASTSADQEIRRRQELIAALAQDQHQATARGNRVFLAAWSDEMPLETELTGAGWEPLDTTLHLVELSVQTDQPLGTVRVTPDQFTWVALERPPLATNLVPVNGALGGEDLAVFRYTPLSEARLSDVEGLIITLDSRNMTSETFPLEVWNWQTQDWNLLELPRVQESLTRLHSQRISAPAAYIGPMNAVQLRIFADPGNNFMTLVRLSVEQEGRF
jgi:hypothetical protein